MGASAFFHNYFCMNSDAKNLLKWDLAGICMMIMGSCTPPFYYGMQCEESWGWGKFYLIQVYSCCLLALLVTLFQDSCGKISSNFKRKLQASCFLIAGYSCAPALIHMGYFSAPDQVFKFAVWPWLVGGILYGIGAIIYALRFPERYFKRTFDIFGSSHNLFHFFILAAALLHIWASIRCFHERQLYPCPEAGKLETSLINGWRQHYTLFATY